MDDFAILKGKLIKYNGSRDFDVTIPDDVIEISNKAFRREGYMDSACFVRVHIPGSVKRIENGTVSRYIHENDSYYGCFSDSSVKSVTFENGIEEIGDYAFYDCRSLESVNLPNSLLRIGCMAFHNSAITTITIPATVRSMESAFSWSKLNKAIIADGATQVLPHAFSGCKELQQITLPPSITEICDGAFAECRKLARIRIPKSVRKIGKDAFSGCISLVDINNELVDLFARADVSATAFQRTPIGDDYVDMVVKKRICTKCGKKLSLFHRCKACGIKPFYRFE